MNTLGTAVETGKPVAVDMEKLVGSHVGIVAQAGAGKSYTLRKFLEVTHGALQHIVLDSEDEFYTLRERFDYVIAGGENGDFPATASNAPQIARALLENGLSAVIQMNGLGRDGARAFVASFLSAVINAPSDLWHPTMIVLDEADRFAPLGERSASSEAVIDYVSKGRKRGFSMAVATQRLSKISRDATGDVHNWLFGRVGQGTDRKRVADEIGFSSTSNEGRGLMSLAQGEFWIRGPALAQMPTLVRVGEVVTSHMRAGQGRVPTPPPAGKMKKIVAALAAAAQPPKEEKRVADAATATVAAAQRSPNPEEIEAAERRGYERGHAEGFDAGVEAGWQTASQTVSEALGRALPNGSAARPKVLEPAQPMPKARPPRTKPADGATMSAGALNLLAAIQRFPGGIGWSDAAIVAGITPGNGYFYGARKAILASGEVVGDETPIPNHPRGMAPTVDEIVDLWGGKLKAPAPSILRYLRDARSDTTQRVATAIGAKPGNGYWYGGLKALRKNGLIVQDGAHLSLSPFIASLRTA